MSHSQQHVIVNWVVLAKLGSNKEISNSILQVLQPPALGNGVVLGVFCLRNAADAYRKRKRRQDIDISRSAEYVNGEATQNPCDPSNSQKRVLAHMSAQATERQHRTAASVEADPHNDCP